jgi:uncharacterized protein
MEIKSLPTPPSRPAIQSYGPDGFRVANAFYPEAIMVFASGVSEWSAPHRPLCQEDFSPAFERSEEFDVLLIGCGASGVELPHALMLDLRTQGLRCEVMDTGAACRTYNLLIAEGRRAAAALLPPR